ncbi:hypothetical protein KAJ87_01525 [Candidatus Pacearchaeota archaeon]|nr:hypothetical protein [Candidatus Pacearchaeota archaeon]
MKIEQHEEAFKEHLENINRAIDEGVIKNQRNIGFNVSQGSVELFSLFLHKLHLIEGSGDQFDHRIFKNKNLINKKLPFDFPLKNKILSFMKEIELERIALCYGSRKPKFRIENVLRNFQELRKIINEGLKNEKK